MYRATRQALREVGEFLAVIGAVILFLLLCGLVAALIALPILMSFPETGPSHPAWLLLYPAYLAIFFVARVVYLARGNG